LLVERAFEGLGGDFDLDRVGRNCEESGGGREEEQGAKLHRSSITGGCMDFGVWTFVMELLYTGWAACQAVWGQVWDFGW
jgi:hypothetical protein